MTDPLFRFPIRTRVRHTERALDQMYGDPNIRARARDIHATVLGKDEDLLLVRFAQHDRIHRADPADLEIAPAAGDATEGNQPTDEDSLIAAILNELLPSWPQIVAGVLIFAAVVGWILWQSRFR